MKFVAVGCFSFLAARLHVTILCLLPLVNLTTEEIKHWGKDEKNPQNNPKTLWNFKNTNRPFLVYSQFIYKYRLFCNA